MREIKFRAWIESQKCFAFVDLNEKGIFYKTSGVLVTNGGWQQYTGLKDKNGKEIYEGDIVKDGSEISRVEFHEGCFGVHYDVPESYPHKYCQAFGEAMARDYEVIGNCFENPELLESK